ncbi:MAG TPA: LLM class F420-dependent oxidoreductase [Terriglobales bacterium]|nr:LLM class F420-dependent oxidoreductase [Terriglobales bacterium]
MKVGINLLNFGPGASPGALLAWTRLAEGLGYHLVMISDHVAMTADVTARYPAPFYDPWVSLGWLAGQTQNVELGTTVVIVPYRHPLDTARLVANVDQLSGGRFIFGVGVGWARQEFDALGVPFEKRGAMTNEYLEAIRACWTQDVASFDGRFVRFRDVTTTPRPIRVPPIWVGGGTDAAMKRAAVHGDAWHPIRVKLPFLREALPRLRKMADDAKRPMPALCPRMHLRVTSAPVAEDGRLMGHGTVDQIRRDFAALAELGATYVLLDTVIAEDVGATANHEAQWAMLATLADRVLDLPRQTLR